MADTVMAAMAARAGARRHQAWPSQAWRPPPHPSAAPRAGKAPGRRATASPTHGGGGRRRPSALEGRWRANSDASDRSMRTIGFAVERLSRSASPRRRRRPEAAEIKRRRRRRFWSREPKGIRVRERGRKTTRLGRLDRAHWAGPT